MGNARCDQMRKYDGFNDGHSKHFSEGDCEELKDAAKSMFESRRVVKFTYVREFLLEKAIFQLEDKHGPEAEIVVAKRAQLSLFRQWQEPYINAIDKLSEMIERPDAVRLLKPRRERKRLRTLTETMKRQAMRVSEQADPA